MDKNKERNFTPPIFLTFYSDRNTSISKKLGILGWKEEQKDLVHGSLIFIYVTKEGIECCFEIKNKLDSMDYIWEDEVENKQIIYKNRWSALLIGENLDISLKEMNSIPPFNNQRLSAFFVPRGPYRLPQNKTLNDTEYSVNFFWID